MKATGKIEEANKNLIRAHQLKKEGKASEAIKYYQAALVEIDGETVQAWQGMANIYEEKQEWDAAEKCYQKLIEISPGQLDNYINLAKTLKLQNKENEYVKAINKASRKTKKPLWGIYGILGNILKEQGKLDEAIIVLQEAVKIQPDHPSIYRSLATAQAQKGNFQEVISSYKNIIRLIPDNSNAYIELARAMIRAGNIQEAIDIYKQVISLSKNTAARIYLELGNALEKNNQVNEALNVYKTGIELFPDNINFYKNTGRIYFNQDNFHEVINNYQKVINQKLDLTSLIFLDFYYLKYALNAQGREQEIIDYINLYIDRGKKLANEGNLEEAIKIYRFVIDVNPELALSPKLAFCYYFLGEALYSKNETEKAEPWLKLATSMFSLSCVSRNSTLESLISKIIVENTLIVTFVSDLYYNKFLIWYKIFKQYQLKNLLVVTLDPIVHKKLKKLDITTYLLNIFSYQPNFTFILWIERVKLLKIINGMNINFVLTGLDALWLKNPLNLFCSSEHDLVASVAYGSNKDILKEWGFILNADFYFIKSNHKTQTMFNDFLNYTEKTCSDQAAINQLLFDNNTTWQKDGEFGHQGLCEKLNLSVYVLSDKIATRSNEYLSNETYVFQPHLTQLHKMDQIIKYLQGYNIKI